MSEEQKFEKVKRIVAEQLGAREDEIHLSSNLVNDLNMDSLDHVELIMALEDEFNVEITDEDAEKTVTVQDLLNLLPGRTESTVSPT